MTINELIKSAIKDKVLRAKFLNDPVRTCKDCGIIIDVGDLGNPGLPLFTDLTGMQGGYRP